MTILKSATFDTVTALAKYVNENNIKREDILSIDRIDSSMREFTILYYGDAEIEEKKRGFFS
jgi:hypothetical protein